jgi:hypothetical protein
VARHPMSSSCPQLTARTSVCGQSSGLGLQGEDTAAARTMITTLAPRPSAGRRARCTAPEPPACGEGSSPGFQVGVIRCRAELLGFKHYSPRVRRSPAAEDGPFGRSLGL